MGAMEEYAAFSKWADRNFTKEQLVGLLITEYAVGGCAFMESMYKRGLVAGTVAIDSTRTARVLPRTHVQVDCLERPFTLTEAADQHKAEGYVSGNVRVSFDELVEGCDEGGIHYMLVTKLVDGNHEVMAKTIEYRALGFDSGDFIIAITSYGNPLDGDALN